MGAKKYILLIAVMIVIPIAMPVYAGAEFNGQILILGDSIQNPKQVNNYGSYIMTTLMDKYGVPRKNIKNMAKSYATLAKTSKCKIKKNIFNQYKSKRAKVLKGKYQYIFIAGGVNDYIRKVNCGYSEKGLKDKSTVCGSLNYILNDIQDSKKNIKVIVITPIAKKSCKNKGYGTLQKYRNSIKKTAKKYNGVIVIDGKKLVKNKEIKNTAYSEDGLHPKAKFVKNTVQGRLAKILDEKLGGQAKKDNRSEKSSVFDQSQEELSDEWSTAEVCG